MSRSNTTANAASLTAPTAFSDYLARIGSDAEAARILGVTERRVRSWRYRERHPRVRDIPQLIRRSGGELSLDSFFEPDVVTHGG